MKNEQRYDERDLAVIQASQHFDANESMFFARELEQVKAKTYDKKFAELTATRVIPVSSDVKFFESRAIILSIPQQTVSATHCIRQRSQHCQQ